eukprot:gene26307-29717_t
MGADYYLVMLFIFLGIFGLCNAACPNDCSKRGKCSIENVCICDELYRVAPDCSQQSCPFGRAWADKASAVDTAHASAECSNLGHCNRKTGTCECFDGFEGYACERTKCNCNGHGVCQTTGVLYQTYNPVIRTDSYELWDEEHTTSCVCDYGYTGPSCNIRMCPKGDDPFTYFSDYRAIIITLSAYSAGFSGSFKLTYDSLTIAIPASGWTDELCQQAFQALPAFKTVRCSLSFATTRYGGFSLQVEFIEFAPIPYQNNIYTHEGDPALSAFKCDTSGITTTGSVTCGITNVVYGSLPEYVYCSNRGTCDTTTGLCKCYSNFITANCGAFSYGLRALDTLRLGDIMTLQNTRADFTGNILQLKTTYNGTS